LGLLSDKIPIQKLIYKRLAEKPRMQISFFRDFWKEGEETLTFEYAWAPCYFYIFKLKKQRRAVLGVFFRAKRRGVTKLYWYSGCQGFVTVLSVDWCAWEILDTRERFQNAKINNFNLNSLLFYFCFLF